MATVTLTLYRKCKIEPDKNFILDDIEAYLSELENITIENVQYQRFDLMKKIKLDMSQDFQTNSTDASIGNKYNYMKIETAVGEGSAVYYYFITDYEQTAQQTITLYIEMDTLNTFHFSDTAANNTYTLSEKTTVKREHKDRLVKTGTAETYKEVDPTTEESDTITAWKNSQWRLGREVSIAFQYGGFVSKWRDTPAVGMVWPIDITPNSTNYKINLVKVTGRNTVETVYSYDVDSNYNISISPEYIQFVQLFTGETITWAYKQIRELNLGVLITVTTPSTLGEPSTFSPAANWDYIKEFFLESKVLQKQAIENVYRREINEYNEGINTTLFKKNEETLYDEDAANQWYLTYLSKDPVVSDDDTAPNYVNPVIAELYSDTGYTVSPRTSHEVEVFATDIKTNYPNQPELLGYNSYFSPLTAGVAPWLGTLPYVGVFFNAAVSGPKHTPYEDIAPCPTARGQQYIIANGVTYDAYDYAYILFERTNNSDTTFSTLYAARRTNPGTFTGGIYVPPEIIRGPFNSFIVYGLNELRQISGYYDSTLENILMYVERFDRLFVGSGNSTVSGVCPPFKERDLTDSRLIKIFNFPYAPIDWVVGETNLPYVSNEEFSFDLNDNALKLNKIQNIEFSYQKQLPYASPLSEIKLRYDASTLGFEKPRDIHYESKLYHSDYYEPKFVYDSFTFPFNLENLNIPDVLQAFPNVDNTFTFTYTVTRNILSKFMFQFDECLFKRSTLDYDNVLLINRNNEKALYTNAFINYIRSGGYNNDAQKNADQQTMNGIASGVGLATSIGTLVAGIAATASGYGAPMGIGAVIGGVAGIASSTLGLAKSIVTAQEQDKAYAQKVNELQMQGTSVIGNEDIDLLTKFSDNKPKLVYYELSDLMKNAMWDLFHYCGYATNEQKVPTHDSRLYFNFIQADIVYEDYTFNEEVAQDIQEKWAQGVTYIHKARNATNTGYIWDMDQEYENFEVSLL